MKREPFKLKVRVTREDIRRGFPNCGEDSCCPLALALKRTIKQKGLKFRNARAWWDTVDLGGTAFHPAYTAVIDTKQKVAYLRIYDASMGHIKKSAAKPFTLDLEFEPLIWS